MKLSPYARHVRELNSLQDAILLNKKEELSVVGLFDADRDGFAIAAFESAAQTFAKGAAFGKSAQPEVWEKYEKHSSSGPAILLFRDFDPETGKRKRGKKVAVEFAGDLSSGRAISEFVLSEGLPHVVEMPEITRAGVDTSARASAAMRLPLLPKLVLFKEGSSRIETPLHAACATLRSKAMCISVDLTDDAEGSASTLQRAGLTTDDIGDDGVLVSLTPDWTGARKLVLSGAAALPDPAALAEFAQGGAAPGGAAAPSRSAPDSATAGSTPTPTPTATVLTAANFDAAVLEGDRVWVVLFTSASSADAAAFRPTWDGLATSLQRMSLGTVDVDDEAELASRLGVRAAPSVLLFGDADAALAARVMDGGKRVVAGSAGVGATTSLKKLRIGLKKAVKGFKKGLKLDHAGMYVKQGVAGNDPATVLKAGKEKTAGGGDGENAQQGQEKKTSKNKNKKADGEDSGASAAPATDYYLHFEIHPGCVPSPSPHP